MKKAKVPGHDQQSGRFQSGTGWCFFGGGWSDGEKHCGDGGAVGCSLKLGAAKPGGAACSEMEAFK